NREGTERDSSQSLAESRGRDRAAEFRLRDFAFAGNPKARAAVSNGPPIIATHRGNKKQVSEKKFLQYLDRTDCGNESAARNQKRPEARNGNAGKNFRRRALQSAGQFRLKRGGHSGGLVGDRRIRAANVARGKSARRQSTPRARTPPSRARRK